MKTETELRKAVMDWTELHVASVNDVEALRKIVIKSTHMLVAHSSHNQLIAMLAALTMPIDALEHFDDLPESEQFELLKQYGGMQ